MDVRTTGKPVVALSTICVGLIFPALGGRPAAAEQAPAGAPAQSGALPQLPGSPGGVTPGPVTPQQGLPEIPSLRPALPNQPLTASPTLQQTAPTLAGRPLTIQEAVALALATNRTLAESAETLYRIQGRTGEVRAQSLPVLGAQFGDIYQNSLLEPAVIIAGTLPIDITGLLHAATSQAQFQEVAARLDLNRARNQVISDVKAAFYAVLRAKALVAVATEGLQNSLDRLKDANLRYQARATAYFDVVRAQTDVANARRQLIQARNAVSLNTAALANAIGIQVTTALQASEAGAVEQPPGVPPPPAPLPPPAGNRQPENPTRPEPLQLSPADLTAPPNEQVLEEAQKLGPDYQPLLDEAMVNRPEILDSEAVLAAARKGLQLAKRSVLPSLGLTAGFYDFRSSSGTRIEEPRAGLQLVVPVFDAGVSKARKQQARGEIAVATTEQRRVVDQITLEVQQAYLNEVQAREQVAVANQGLVQAQQGYDLARRRYQAGFSPLLEVSDAQAALTLAETNQVEALYNYNQSRVLLDRAVGRYAYGAQGPGYPAPPPAKVVGTPSPKLQRRTR